MAWSDNKQRNTKEKGYPNKNWRLREQEEKEYEEMIRDAQRRKDEGSYRVDPLDKRYTLDESAA